MTVHSADVRPPLQRLCVFSGSNSGCAPAFAEAARELGACLAERRIGLVFGGARVGLMGEVARAALARGGQVTGVIPRDLAAKGVAFEGLADLRLVDSMHERKALMAELSDGFIALPGGFGTIEELFEMLTWAQLGLHAKPCGLLNVAGYFDALSRFLDEAVLREFVRPEHRAMVLAAERPQDLLESFVRYRPPRVGKWIEARAT